MTTNASRAPVDFDAFARDLQQPQPAPSQGTAESQVSAKADPLAELARIIGQDDPFRAILAARDARPDSAPGQRIEPSFVDAPASAHPAPAYRSPPAASPTDAFDQYLASVEQTPYPIQGAEVPEAEQDAFASGERVPLGRPRQRSRLVSVGAGLGVVAVCITAGLAWRGLHSGGGTGGGVPTILADTAPLKVAPQKADGVEIPDQNKQIYDRTAKDGQIRIVNREEQPLDVAQAARSAQGTSEGGATPGSATGNASAPPTGTLTESLGEPRRVRTVSVKPETPPPPPQPEAAEPPQASVIPTMTLPGTSTEGASTRASLRPRAGRVSVPLTTPTATPVAEAPASTPVPAPAPAPRVKAPQRVAAVAPETTAAVAPPPATATESPAPAAGSFSVQLGVRNSASEAQAAFTQMQGKYAPLAGKPALIRQAEVNGKALYRVRVGPLGKAEATSLCSQLQAAGGQCFVAKN
jgi:hypothetical protein